MVLRLTQITKLIPDWDPATNGACDTVAAGMGGVHFVPTDTKKVPLLWRQWFPDWIRKDLCFFAHPKGSITNNDLELAGSIANNNVLAQATDVREKTTHNSYDNIAVVFWQRKRATTTLGPAAFLLPLQALQQRYYCYVPLRDYIPGPLLMSWLIFFQEDGI